MPRPRLVLAALLAAAACAALAQPPNHSVTLAVQAGAGKEGSSRSALLGAATWLEGDFEAIAWLGMGSAPRTDERAADLAVTPAAGLRWAPDLWRWRLIVEVECGLVLPVGGWGEAQPTAAGRAGVEVFLRTDLSLGAGMGARWIATLGWSPEGTLGARLYF